MQHLARRFHHLETRSWCSLIFREEGRCKRQRAAQCRRVAPSMRLSGQSLVIHVPPKQGQLSLPWRVLLWPRLFKCFNYLKQRLSLIKVHTPKTEIPLSHLPGPRHPSRQLGGDTSGSDVPQRKSGDREQCNLVGWGDLEAEEDGLL